MRKRMKLLDKFLKTLRKTAANHGFTCDVCKAEVFSYPNPRLCGVCLSRLDKNDGFSCPKCGRKTLAEGVCLSCKALPPRFTFACSPFSYEGKTAAILNRVKNGDRRIAHFFGDSMADEWIARFKQSVSTWKKEETLLLLPVPLTQEKRRERGYNQAEELAEAVCARLIENGYAAEMDVSVLEKRRDTPQQKHLGFSARAENVSGAYHVHKRKACQGKTIVLVDDVMTTGATGSECAKLLLSAGAKAVWFLTATSLPESKRSET